jgi:hypothetical protein
MKNYDKHWLLWNEIIELANKEAFKKHVGDGRNNYVPYLKSQALQNITIKYNIAPPKGYSACYLCDKHIVDCDLCPLVKAYGIVDCTRVESLLWQMERTTSYKKFIECGKKIRDCVPKSVEYIKD